MDNRKKFFPYIALGIGILCLGFSGIFVQWADASGTVTSFYRMMVGSLVAFPLFLNQVKKNGSFKFDGMWFPILGGIFFGIDMALWSEGVRLAGATTPTLMSNTAPVWVGLGASIFLKEKLNKNFWGGVVIAMIGAAIILGIDLQDINFGRGAMMALLAGIFYGIFFLVSQKGRSKLNALTFFWFSVTGSAFALGVIALIFRLPLTGYSNQTYLVFLVFGLVVQVLGWVSINYAQGYLPASIVSPTMLGQPITTSILAIPLLGETLKPGQYGGGVAVIIGIFIVHRSRTKKTKIIDAEQTTTSQKI